MTDSGDGAVPAGARWGRSTQLAVENFPVSGRPVPPSLIRALARIKRAAARANAVNGTVATGAASTIAAAATEVVDGAWVDQFPVDVFQTGSGTSTNMNVNEVLASLAGERLGAPVHPNDDVNAGQSSNDVFPSAIRLAALGELDRALLPALDHLAATLGAKADELVAAVKAGRTHLMDATPVTLGQELGGHRTQVLDAVERLAGCRDRVGRLPLGGTAVGTGLNAPAGFAAAVCADLAAETGLPLTEAPDHFAVQGAQDALVELSGHLRSAAVALFKVANDLRWLASGPRTGLAEIALPALQPGSSIMPGKVNPVIPESVLQVAARVLGNDATVAFAGTQGNLELNVFLPVIAEAVLDSIELLANVARLLADRCIAGLTADTDRMRRFAESSPAIATALNGELGYDTVAEVVKESIATDRTIREVVLDRALLDAERLDELLDVDAMTRPPT